MNAFELTAEYPATAGSVPSYYSLDLLVLATHGKIFTAQVFPERNQLISLYEYSCPGLDDPSGYFEAMGDLFDTAPVFQKPHRREVFALDHPYSTLVPEDIFNKNLLKDYLSLSFELPDGMVAMSDALKGAGLRNIFCIPERGMETILSRFPASGIHHIATPMLAGLFQDIQHYAGEEVVFCLLRQDVLELTVFRKGKLHYHNSFSYNNKEEFIYYILFVMEQLSLSPARQQVVFLGDVRSRAAYLDYSRTYLGAAETGRPPFERKDVLASPVPDLVEHFILLSLRLCV